MIVQVNGAVLIAINIRRADDDFAVSASVMLLKMLNSMVLWGVVWDVYVHIQIRCTAVCIIIVVVVTDEVVLFNIA
jgi:hypothetical protein